MDKNDLLNFILDNYKGIRKERALRILNGQLKETDKEYKKYVKNELVRDRWKIIAEYKEMDFLYEQKRIYQEYYEMYIKNKDIVKASEFHLAISKISETIDTSLKIISVLGEHFIDVLSSDLLSEHEVCQLLNINWQTFQNKKQRYIKNFNREDKIIFKVVSVTGVEYREKKGRIKGIYDCPEYEMPIYWAMYETITQEIEKNKELQECTRKKFKELFPDLKTYTAVKDLEGNIVKLVENKEE